MKWCGICAWYSRPYNMIVFSVVEPPLLSPKCNSFKRYITFSHAHTHTLGQSLLLLSLFSFVTFIVTCGHSGSCIMSIRILSPKAIKITAHVDCTMPWSETYAISIDIGNNFEPPQCTITNWQRDARMNSPTHREAHRLAVCPPTYNFMLLRLTQQTHNTKVQKSA